MKGKQRNYMSRSRGGGGIVGRFVMFVGMLVSVSTGSVAVAEPLY